MKFITLSVIPLIVLSASTYASDSAVCQFLPPSPMPSWVNNDTHDDDYYYAVGGASGKSGEKFVPINVFISNAREDAIANLSSSIRSSIKVSTKRTIESKKSTKTKAEIRKEVKYKSELVSQTALSAVIDDVRWLDNKNCLLWYRVKVSKAGAEFAVTSYVNDVEQRLTKRIDELTKREIEQILSDNGFAPTSVDATRALLNNRFAVYRGQQYNIAELYHQSGFDWLDEEQSETFSIKWANVLFYGGTPSLNVPMSVVVSGSSPENITRALKQLKSFGIDLNNAKVSIGKQSDKLVPFTNKGQYSDDYYTLLPVMNTQTQNKSISTFVSLKKKLKRPFVYNFNTVEGFEYFGLMHTVAMEHRIDLIKPLSELGISLNQSSAHGYTPLAVSLELRDIDFASQLIQLGANIKANDYIAYKVAYLNWHLNNHVTPASTAQLPIPLPELKQITNALKPNKKIKFSIEQFIHNIAPIEVIQTTHYLDTNKYEKITFVNGEVVK